ncbi:MAG: deoxyribose-phosphate aldolase, partial [Planctomycetes bacterium]|nr:deoxyribose-phosphate aldolase [Planctomycetota bacterium]
AALAEAERLLCRALCVHPCWVSLLRGARIPIVTVAGFPLGADRTEVKAKAAAMALEDGASEIDMVLNLGALKSKDLPAVAADVRAVRRAAAAGVLKVILETGLLGRSEAEEAARVAVGEGADFLKTSTGFGPRGATVEDVLLLRRFGRVKASGGIRTFAQAEALVGAGAERLGASASAAILGGAPGA